MTPRTLRFDPIEEASRQWGVRNWPEVESMAAATSVMRVQQLILSSVDAALEDLDLSFARYEALVLLSFSRRHALPLGKMGERLMIHPTSVTNIVDRLEAQGLVRRLRECEDGRVILAEMTAAGGKIVQKATRRVTAVTFGITGLSAGEMLQLTSLLRKVRLTSGDFSEADADNSS
jgi:DNA-binding MarR family transcriptional regulator